MSRNINTQPAVQDVKALTQPESKILSQPETEPYACFESKPKEISALFRESAAYRAFDDLNPYLLLDDPLAYLSNPSLAALPGHQDLLDGLQGSPERKKSQVMIILTLLFVRFNEQEQQRENILEIIHKICLCHQKLVDFSNYRFQPETQVQVIAASKNIMPYKNDLLSLLTACHFYFSDQAIETAFDSPAVHKKGRLNAMKVAGLLYTPDQIAIHFCKTYPIFNTVLSIEMMKSFAQIVLDKSLIDRELEIESISNESLQKRELEIRSALRVSAVPQQELLSDDLISIVAGYDSQSYEQFEFTAWLFIFNHIYFSDRRSTQFNHSEENLPSFNKTNFYDSHCLLLFNAMTNNLKTFPLLNKTYKNLSEEITETKRSTLNAIVAANNPITDEVTQANRAIYFTAGSSPQQIQDLVNIALQWLNIIGKRYHETYDEEFKAEDNAVFKCQLEKEKKQAFQFFIKHCLIQDKLPEQFRRIKLEIIESKLSTGNNYTVVFQNTSPPSPRGSIFPKLVR